MSELHQGQDRGRRTLPAVLALLALVLGVGLLSFALLNQRADPPTPGSASSSDAPAPSLHSHPEPAEGSGSGQGAEPDRSEADPGEADPGETDPGEAAQPAEPPPSLEASEPVEVRIPTIGVTSPLHPLGLEPDGTLAVPTGDRVDEAAWYDGSPAPGQIGPTVIEGHVTGPGGRPSIFFELGALSPGDRIEVDRADGLTVTYEVYDVRQFAKSSFPTVQVYGPTSGPELRLITCGGEFDATSGHHLDNTVVSARVIDLGT